MNAFPGYDADHEEAMRVYCRLLPEDHRRSYGAIEALKIGNRSDPQPAIDGV